MRGVEWWWKERVGVMVWTFEGYETTVDNDKLRAIDKQQRAKKLNEYDVK